MVRYCLPIIKKTKEEVVNTIRENSDYDFFEVWLSYIEDLDTDFVWKISEEFNGKIIFLFRKLELEKSNLKREDREKIIKLLENSENFLDLDINDQKEELEFVKKNKSGNKLIVSYHNYEETPSLKELEKIVEQIDSGSQTVQNDSRIFKVCTFCKDKEDSIKLITLLLKLKEEGLKYIVLGMGKEGVVTRVFGAIFGNEMNFAPDNLEEKSADGQLTRNQLENVLKELDSSPAWAGSG